MGLFSIKKTTMGKIAANLLWNDGLRQWHPTPVLLPGKSHGWRSLVGCSPWGCYKSDTTERLHFHALEKEMATHSRILAWRIPGTGEPGGLPPVGSHRVGCWLSSNSILKHSQVLCLTYDTLAQYTHTHTHTPNSIEWRSFHFTIYVAKISLFLMDNPFTFYCSTQKPFYAY